MLASSGKVQSPAGPVSTSAVCREQRTLTEARRQFDLDCVLTRIPALPPYLLRNPTTTTSPRLPLLLSLLALLLPLVVFLATLLVFIHTLRQSSAASFAPTIPLNPTSDPQGQQPAFLNAGPDFVHLLFVLGLICEISLVFVGGREVYRYWRRRYLRERPGELGEGRAYVPQGAIKTLERFLCLSPREILPPRPSRCTMVQVGEADEEYGSIERALREGAAPGYGSREMRSSTLVLWGPKLGEQERSEEMERAERRGRPMGRGGIV